MPGLIVALTVVAVHTGPEGGSLLAGTVGSPLTGAHGTLTLAPTRTLRLSTVSPSRRTVTCAGPGGSTATAWW